MKILGFEIGEVKPRIELPSPSPCPPPHNIGLPVATERIVEVTASAILQDRIDHLTRTAHGVTQACGNQMNKLITLITDIRKHLGPDFVKPNNLKYRPADVRRLGAAATTQRRRCTTSVRAKKALFLHTFMSERWKAASSRLTGF